MENDHKLVLDEIKKKFDLKSLKVAYIKLGRGEDNPKRYITNKQFYIGYGSNEDDIYKELVDRTLSAENFYEFIRKHGDQNHLGPKALKTVYEDKGDTLWYTILKGYLYFGLTDPNKKFVKDKQKKDGDEIEVGCVKDMLSGWFNLDSNGEPISKRSVSGKVTKTAKIQGTLAAKTDVYEIELLVRRLLNEETEEKLFVKKSKAELPKNIEKLITQLDESDFEILIETLFLEQGYKKNAKSSGNEASYDLSLERPFDFICNLPTFVQIKSALNKKTYEKVLDDFKSDFQFGGYHSDGYLYYHSGRYSPSVDTSNEINSDKKTLHLVGVECIALQVIKFGKIDWLLERTI